MSKLQCIRDSCDWWEFLIVFSDVTDSPLHSPYSRQFACRKGCVRRLWKSLGWCCPWQVPIIFRKVRVFLLTQIMNTLCHYVNIDLRKLLCWRAWSSNTVTVSHCLTPVTLYLIIVEGLADETCSSGTSCWATEYDIGPAIRNDFLGQQKGDWLRMLTSVALIRWIIVEVKHKCKSCYSW